jgi:hypothetical protein
MLRMVIKSTMVNVIGPREIARERVTYTEAYYDTELTTAAKCL